nr:hypothetical protein [Tanacetum cinerariifolium]
MPQRSWGGTPQTEVIFKADANGMFDVKAEDKGIDEAEKITDARYWSVSFGSVDMVDKLQMVENDIVFAESCMTEVGCRYWPVDLIVANESVNVNRKSK